MKKRVTSFDVAKQAGVSRAVVSAVLNDTPGIRISAETRRTVLKAIEDMNYSVDAQARGMRTGRSGCIAVYGNLQNQLLLQVLQGVQLVCNERGYHLMLIGQTAAADDRNHLIDLYRQRRIDGMITKDATGYDNPDWVEQVQQAGLPYISVEGYPEALQVESVLMDYGESIRRALSYIADRTSLAPVYLEVYNGPEYKPHWGDSMRCKAYEEWMTDRGMKPIVIRMRDDELDSRQRWDDAIRQFGLEQQAAILSNWFAGSVAAYRTAYRLGLTIGHDWLIMSADNTAQANSYLVPGLSAVEVPYVEMGEAAANRLLERIEGHAADEPATKLWIPANLISRESL